MRRAVIGAVAGWMAAAGAVAGAGPAGADPAPAVEQVLIVSLPGVTWHDITVAEAPHLRRLLRDSALASASLRVFHRTTPAGEGYATIGAGALMGGHRRLTAQAYPDAGGAGIVTRAPPMLARLAAGRKRGAEVGALGDALARAGVSRAVIANADAALDDPAETTWHREATIALAGRDGRIPAGEVSRALLMADPAAPFGVRLDPAAVRSAFRAAWRPRSAVLVEASDLARAQEAGTGQPPSTRRRLVGRALAATDEILGLLVADVDPARHAVLVVTPSTPPAEVHLGVAALRAPGVGRGLLRSASTRRSGFVTLADIGPTVLDLLGAPRPPAMEGRAVEVGRPGPADLADLVEADRESRLRDRLVAPVTAGFVAVQILLVVAGALALTRRRPRGVLARALAFAALWVLGAMAAAWWPAVVDVRTPAGWGLVVGLGGLAVAAGAALAGRRGCPLRRLAAALAVLLAVLVADVVGGLGLQLSAVFGYSPTAGGRFSGFGNLAFAQVAAAAVILAVALAHLVGGRRGAWAGVAVLGIAMVTDGWPAWGADVGGVLAGLPGYAVVAAGLLGLHLSVPWALALAAGSVVVAAGFGGLDLLRPAGERTHLGRLLERIGDEGMQPLREVIDRKSDVAWNLAGPAARRWLPLVPIGLGFVGWLAMGSRAPWPRLAGALPRLSTAVAGLLVVAVLGFAVNDSGVAIPAMMLAVLNPVLVHLALSGDGPA